MSLRTDACWVRRIQLVNFLQPARDQLPSDAACNLSRDDSTQRRVAGITHVRREQSQISSELIAYPAGQVQRFQILVVDVRIGAGLLDDEYGLSRSEDLVDLQRRKLGVAAP